MKDYRQLNVWVLAHAVALDVYRVTRLFPKEEAFGLTGQMRRAATSIPSNIAEGCGRYGDPELKRFVNIALGSACELDYQVLLARELGYLETSGSELPANILQLRKMLGALLRRLK